MSIESIKAREAKFNFIVERAQTAATSYKKRIRRRVTSPQVLYLIIEGENGKAPNLSGFSTIEIQVALDIAMLASDNDMACVASSEDGALCLQLTEL